MAVCAFAFELNEHDLESDLGKRLGLASALILAIFKTLPQYPVNLLQFAKVKFVRISEMKSKRRPEEQAALLVSICSYMFLEVCV